jgi:hypothetical protein
MGHGQAHHYHHGAAPGGGDVPPLPDPSIRDGEQPPDGRSRRAFLRRAGLLGLGTAATAGVVGASGPFSAAPALGAVAGHGTGRHRSSGLTWLTGDHHTHTQYSSDGQYRVNDNVRHAAAYGLDWMVITDHGNAMHVKIGAEKLNRDIRAARAEFKDMLLFQGLEWNIPAADHGTVFVHPGRTEVAVLKEFENTFDGAVTGATAATPTNEALALAGVNFLAGAVAQKRIADALFIANHPARKGINTPHEIRAWQDTAAAIAVGMEGAPGHQAAGIKAPYGPGSIRGSYDASPSADSFTGYPLDGYRTYGGFDWMTATVGGLWDSLLAEGRPWWITASSDVHGVYCDTSTRGPGSDFNRNGYIDDPVYGTSVNLGNGDFWPGYYSRTHVGVRDVSYAAVMDGIRRGRIWVDHGALIDGLDVQLRVKGMAAGVPLGDTLVVRRGAAVELVIRIELASRPNWAQFLPTLARVDVIAGEVTGPVADRDVFTTPASKVVRSYDTSTATGSVMLIYDVGAVDRALYFRVRGTDGARTAPGLLGAGVDPSGPALDVAGDADPWRDLWFYANPIWVVPR